MFNRVAARVFHHAVILRNDRLSGQQDAKCRGVDCCLGSRSFQSANGFFASFVGQLPSAPMHCEANGRTNITMDRDRFRRIAMQHGQEPAGLVGADRNHREVRSTEALTDLTKQIFAIPVSLANHQVRRPLRTKKPPHKRALRRPESRLLQCWAGVKVTSRSAASLWLLHQSSSTTR